RVGVRRSQLTRSPSRVGVRRSQLTRSPSRVGVRRSQLTRSPSPSSLPTRSSLLTLSNPPTSSLLTLSNPRTHPGIRSRAMIAAASDGPCWASSYRWWV
ncbi:MAG: hypothetical protein U0L04_02250, partial [Bacteroidaceae bacterium]|nr:hypothetical protein [Bacteroidaceae bacterium]